VIQSFAHGAGGRQQLVGREVQHGPGHYDRRTLRR
jgi:hypothetical protein